MTSLESTTKRSLGTPHYNVLKTTMTEPYVIRAYGKRALNRAYMFSGTALMRRETGTSPLSALVFLF